MYPTAYREVRNPSRNTIPRKNAERPSMNSSDATHGTGAGMGMRTGPRGKNPPRVKASPRNEATAPPPNPAMRERAGSRIHRAAIPENSQVPETMHKAADGVIQ
jgi:hypothetical protein